jgi:hypothetical protein
METRRNRRNNNIGETQGLPEGAPTPTRPAADVAEMSPTFEEDSNDASTRPTSPLSEMIREEAANALPPFPDNNPMDARAGPEISLHDQIRQMVRQIVEESQAAPPERIEFLERQLSRLEQLNVRTDPGIPTETHGKPFDQVRRLIGVLEKVNPKPYLGSKGYPPSPQQVERWIGEVEMAFEYAQVLEDSPTRTQWVVGTISYTTHKDLIMNDIRQGHIRTWSDLKAKQRGLIQDPVNAKFNNWARLLEWRWDGKYQDFMLGLRQRDAALSNPLFTNEDGTNNDEYLLPHVWAAAPKHLRKVIMSYPGGLEKVETFEQLERLILNAEAGAQASGGNFNVRTKRAGSPAESSTSGSTRGHFKKAKPSPAPGAPLTRPGEFPRDTRYPDQVRAVPQQTPPRAPGQPQRNQRPHWRQPYHGSQGKDKP